MKKAEREGIVIRTSDNVISFKAISNKFLLKDKTNNLLGHFFIFKKTLGLV
jgi:predicted acetyltransferase